MTVPVAQYLRVSTEEQRYSLENQGETIHDYAMQHGFEIVRTYSDTGRSGISLKSRAGIVRLLSDVVGGNAPFKAVLVYDVSRWGRFQDCDEAAHYEFICKSSGVPVHYCAENFSNDNSLPSSIFKAIKRTMAAEYSREMGAKVFAGAQRMAELGFKQGGKAGYGLRRLMISGNGQAKKILAAHETKGLRTDRVVLVPGPEEEVECVREIYRLVAKEKRTPSQITRYLIERGVRCPYTKWRVGLICRILTDPKYAGYNVWNRTTMRLGQPRGRVPKSQWFLKPNAFEPVVNPTTFEEAQRVLAEQKRPYSNDELLESLRRVLRQHGRLSYSLTKNSPDLVSVTTLIKRFGSLRQAFELAGQGYQWVDASREFDAHVRRMRCDLMLEIKSMVPSEVEIISLDSEGDDHLVIDGFLKVALLVCPVMRRKGQLTWIASSRYADRRTTTLLARLTVDNKSFRDFHVLPAPGRHWIRHLGDLKKGRRLSGLEEFCSVARSVAYRPTECNRV